jgi:hypothetical protein
MSHSYNKIWIHAIWSTKYRLPIIKPEIENKVYSLVADELKEISCPVRIINGMPEHIHCLFLQNPQKSIIDHHCPVNKLCNLYEVVASIVFIYSTIMYPLRGYFFNFVEVA